MFTVNPSGVASSLAALKGLHRDYYACFPVLCWSLKQLLPYLPPLPLSMQFISLLEEVKRKYRTSGDEFVAYLSLICAILPESHSLPSTRYMFRKMLRSSLTKNVDNDTMFVKHMCSNRDCDYVYTTYPGIPSDACPRPGCKTPTGSQSPRFRYAVFRWSQLIKSSTKSTAT